MIIKVLGCMIIFAGSAMAGFVIANQKGQRVKEIRQLISALNLLSIEIKFSMTVLPDIMAKICSIFKSNVGQLFGHAGMLMVYENMNASESFYNSMEYICPKLNIDKQDREVLLELGNSLGEVDTDNQLKNVDLVIEQLKLHEKEAEMDFLKSEKLFKSLGVIIGLGVVILII